MSLFSLDNLSVSKINDIEFYCESVDLQNGRKIVLTELPQSGRIIEDNGLYEKSFTIAGSIPTDESKALIEVLEKESEIILTLPYFYFETSVFITERPTIKIHDESKIGMILFSIKCEVSEISTTKKATVKVSENSIRNSGGVLKDSVIFKMQEAFNATVNNISKVNDKIFEVANMLQSATTKIQGLTDPLQEFAQNIQTLQSSITNLLNTPKVLAMQLANVFASFEQIGNTFLEQFEMVKEIFTTDYFSIIAGKSQYSEEMQNSTTEIENFVWLETMRIGCYCLSQAEFENVDQLNEYRKMLLAYHEKYCNRINDPTILLNLHTMISKMKLILLQKQSLLPKLTDLYYYYTCPTAISYEIYGNLDNVDKIIKDNYLEDYTYVDGNIKLYV